MMRWNTAGATILFLLYLTAQISGQAQAVHSSSAIPEQPPDVSYVLSTKDGRTQFHLGEIIELEQAYSSSVPGKYLLLSVPAKIKGHGARFTMTPEQNVTDRVRDDGTRSAFSILHANCGGTGSGYGSSCFSCDHIYSLSQSPIHFPFIVTNQFQIMAPGRYTIQAETASVVLAPLDLESSVPISLASNAFEIDVADDPMWSKQTLQDAITRFDGAHSQYVGKGWDVLPRDQMDSESLAARFDLEWKMKSAAEIMRVLDTEESLVELIRRYDGTIENPGYSGHILLQGIIQSRHRSLALKLLGTRILETDFAVSREMLDQLTAMTLEAQFPDSFSRVDDSWRALYPAAHTILRDYVLALGNSLPDKNANALGPSLKTFKTYATEDFCSGEPLIPESTFKEMLRPVQALDLEP